MELMEAIRKDTGCGLAEAKGTWMHLVKKEGECHWCRGAIPVAELVDCPRCEALNIVLEADPLSLTLSPLRGARGPEPRGARGPEAASWRGGGWRVKG